MSQLMIKRYSPHKETYLLKMNLGPVMNMAF